MPWRQSRRCLVATCIIMADVGGNSVRLVFTLSRYICVPATRITGVCGTGVHKCIGPPYFESFSSLSRPIAQRDLIGSSASPSCSTRLGWSTLFASPSFFDGTWSSRSPHTVARQKLVNFTPWLFASWTATSNGSSLGTCSWGPINNQH